MVDKEIPRVVFAGTPDFAAVALKALLKHPTHHHQYQVIAAYTQPDRPSGRGQKVIYSPVKQVALAHSIEVFQPISLRKIEAKNTLRALQPDLMVVAAYGLILPKSVLNIPRLGCINIHASLLPRWRGAAPIQRAIIANDHNTGITLMQMEKGLDTGPMLSQHPIPIKHDDTGATLHDKLAELGATSLLKMLPEILAGDITTETQQHELATYAAKLDKAEAAIDWQQDAAGLARLIRAFNPWPGAYSFINKQRAKLLMATATNNYADYPAEPGTILDASQQGLVVKCQSGELNITQLQLPGSKVLNIGDALNAPARANLLSPGNRFMQLS